MNEKRGVADSIAALIQEYMHISAQAVTAVTLVTLHTWLLDAADVTPYLHITAPQKQSGKTTLMDLLACLVARPMTTSHISAAGLRRVLDAQPPFTLLFDEVDPVFNRRSEDTAELRAVLNAGFRRGAQVLINVKKGQDWALQAFNVFGPKVLVSIGRLPDTVESRSILIVLERAASDETRKRFRQREVEAAAAPIRAALSTWTCDEVAQQIEDIPASLNGRQADIWEPLLAIADWLGGEWPMLAREAAECLCGMHEDEEPGIALLRHIKEVFSQTEVEALYSIELVPFLIENEEWPYMHIMDGGKPLDVTKLAAMLRPFGIRPRPMRLRHENDKQGRGYYRASFEEIWRRYL